MLRNVSKEELDKILKEHKLWLETDNKEGIRANLSNADLCHANLSYANLYKADLYKADLSFADLSYANLSNADLFYANLSYADLSHAKLSYAGLSHTHLSNADLSYANLSNADLYTANLSNAKGLIYINLSPSAIYIGLTHSKIGCQYIENKKLLKITKKEAKELGLEAKYYEKYKSFIKLAVKQVKNQ